MPCSPRRRIRIVTVAERIDGQVAPGWAGFASAQLDISNGCQDHTVLPYANSVVRPARWLLAHGNPPCDHLARRRCRVHRIPSRVRDDGQRPSCRERMGRADSPESPDGLSGILPVGLFAAAVAAVAPGKAALAPCPPSQSRREWWARFRDWARIFLTRIWIAVRFCS